MTASHPVRKPLRATLLALGLAMGCATEWVSDKPEIERYEAESAKKICRRWAMKQVDKDENPIGLPRSTQPPGSARSYQSYFHECMRRHGWKRVRKKTDDAEDEAPPPE